MKKVTLIDLSSIAHPAWHVSQSDPNPDAASLKTVEAVRRIAGTAPMVGICCDSGRSFRKDIDPQYKATRPAQDAALQHQINLAIATLKQDGFPVWAVPGFEADDLIAAATELALAYVKKPDHGTDEPAFTVEIVSSDKDLLQLVSPRVSVHSISSGKHYGEAGVKEKLGVAPNQVIDWLALCGDKADNIIGAKGIGPVKATELLTKYGNLEDLYIDLRDHGTNFTPALATALKEFEPRLKQVRELIKLRTDVKLPGEGFVALFHERTQEEAIFSGEDETPAELPRQTQKVPDAEQDIPLPFTPLTPADAMNENRPGDEVKPPAPLPFVPKDAPPAPKDAPPVPTAPPDVEALHTRALAAEAAGALPGATMRPLVPPVAPEVLTPRAALPPVNPPVVASQAMVVQDTPAAAPDEWRQQLEPRSMGQAAALAEQLFRSKLFAGYGTPQGVLSTVLAGREFGLQAMASLRGFHIIESKPCMSADLIRALVLKSESCEYFRCTERSATKASFVTKRKGDPEIAMTYTIEEGRAAFQKDDRAWLASGWGKNPADMLIARCGSKLARLVYPEVVFGLYAPSEVTDHAGVE